MICNSLSSGYSVKKLSVTVLNVLKVSDQKGLPKFLHLLRLDLRASIWTQKDWEVASLLINDTFNACQNSFR